MKTRITQIYEGDPKDFTWAGFGSGNGTNLRECTRIIKPGLIFSDVKNAPLFSLDELSKERGIVHRYIDAVDFCGKKKDAKKSARLMKKYEKKALNFNRQIVDILYQFEKDIGKSIDLIVLGGYMRIVGEPLLEAYKDRIINVHPADLSILADNFKRKYVGANAVYDAIKDGQTETRSSVIMVDEEMDHGEIITMGPELKVDEDFLKIYNATKDDNLLKEYVDGTDNKRGHQDIQKEESDHLALKTALKMIANNYVALENKKEHYNEWRKVYAYNRELPYKGFMV